jgi:hypothetical protein
MCLLVKKPFFPWQFGGFEPPAMMTTILVRRNEHH